MKYLSLSFLVILLALASCVQKPTKVSVKQDPVVKEKEDLPIFNGLKVPLGKTTIILDTRSFFDHASAHLYGSVRVDPSHFSYSSSWTLPQLKKKSEEWARYFARLGISKTSNVLIVGQGVQSSMDESRLAFILYALGVQQVGYRPIQFVKWPTTTTESQPLASAPYWDPQIKESLFVLSNEFESRRAAGGVFGSVEPKVDAEIAVIDVRKEADYLKAQKLYSSQAQTINVPLEQMYDPKGFPVDSIRKKIEGLGYSSQTRFLVVSDDFSRASASVLALHAMGLVRAAVLIPEGINPSGRKK